MNTLFHLSNIFSKSLTSILVLLFCLTAPVALYAQLSISSSVINEKGLLPNDLTARVHISRFDNSTAAAEIFIGGFLPEPTETTYQDDFFHISETTRTLNAGAHFFPFGNAFFSPFTRKGKISRYHSRNRKQKYGCNYFSRRNAAPRILPGLSVGLRYQNQRTDRILTDTEAELPFDQTTTVHSIIPEIGYSIQVESLLLGGRFSPLRYNITNRTSNNPNALLGPLTPTEGFRGQTAWNLFVGITL